MRGGGGEEQVSEIEQGFIWLKNLFYPNKSVHLDLYPFVINDVNQGDQLLRRWKEQDKPSNFKGGTSLRLYPVKYPLPFMLPATVSGWPFP